MQHNGALRRKPTAPPIGDPAGIRRAQALLGVAHHLAGDQKTAFNHLQAAKKGDAAIPNLAIGHFAGFRGTDVVRCTNLWVLGLPDQALEVAQRVKSGASTPDLIMYCSGLSLSALVFRWVGDAPSLEDAADRLADHGDFDTAETDFRTALDMADAHSALSWRLRVVTSLARHARGEQDRAVAMGDLLGAYRRFTEGFGTADLRIARALLGDRLPGAADTPTVSTQHLTKLHEA